ncbi:MAG TPA: hypothetical protein VGL53_25320 [Bryobacteraceae bacterium]|jgi:hypothetical protein
MKMFKLFALGSVLTAGLVMAQVPATPTSGQAASSAAKTAKTATTKTKAPKPSDSDIADAKTKNLVWVNLNSKKYHQSSYAQYGKTSNGKFMTEDEAKAGGYKAAQDQKSSKKTPKS